MLRDRKGHPPSDVQKHLAIAPRPLDLIGDILMTTSLFSVIVYVLISTFTPGPSNISSSSQAVLHGYRKTLNYQEGLALGVFSLMVLSSMLSTALLDIFPALEPIMRYVGAVYILYLAYGVLKASYTFTETDVKPLRFVHGMMLNVLNPKLMVYAFTLFSAFLTSITKNLVLVVLVAVLLALTSFCATSLWALFGTTVKTYLRNPRLRAIVNTVLALLLAYAALSLAGIL
jgi:cysteine/O-acetylserine efflux protein